MKLTNTSAIIIGSLIISLSILISGGIIPAGTIQTSKTGNDLSPTTNPTTQPSPAQAKVDPVTAADHLRGDKNARIVLIEYSDFECPFCKSFNSTAQRVIESYNGQVAWVYRHFPLDNLHSKARKEAEASECAAEAGGNEGFWKMLDKIYEVTPSNNGLNLDDLPSLATEIGLDKDKFKSCLDSGKYKNRVEEHYQGGVKAGIRGTPASFLLDTKTDKTTFLPGALPFDELKKSIDTIIKS